MIQRIQTLFLLAAAGLIISMFFTPMFTTTDNEVLLYVKDYTCLIVIFVATVLCITTIVSYKKRIFQIRLCNLNSLILLGLQIFLAVKFFTREPDMIFSITAVFPIAAAILTFIAMRYIARDQALVMASSHLRGPRKSNK